MKKFSIGIFVILFFLISLTACNPEASNTTQSTSASIATPPPGTTTGATGTTPAPARPRKDFELDRIPDIIAPFGEEVDINLSFTNRASEPRLISPLPPDAMIIVLPDTRPPDIVVRSIPLGSQERLLQPGEKTFYKLTWDQSDNNGQQVAPGWYGVKVTAYYQNPSEPSGGSVTGPATRVLILPPEGVMEKTIEVNQSETVNDITITLKRVELTSTGIKVYAFNTPPDYNLPQGPDLAPPQFMVLHAEAEYSVDDNVMKPAFPSAVRFLVDGMDHTWDEYLDPVPRNSRELTFRITKLGEMEGLWEFRIPLESGLPFEARMNTSPTRFLPGEDIMYGISIRNLSSSTLTIDPFPPAMWIKPVDQDEAVYSRAAGDRTLDIMIDYPDSWYHTKGVWDQKDNNGEPISPGWYEIGFEYVITKADTLQSYTTNPTARFEIVRPGSAMNKNLPVNQSVRIGEIEVTLERIEMNAVKALAYIFTKPPGYTVSTEGPPSGSPSLLSASMAEYSVDGDLIRNAIIIQGVFSESGAQLIWGLEPIPVDAQEITFTITKLGYWEGPWEFKIQLE